MSSSSRVDSQPFGMPATSGSRKRAAAFLCASALVLVGLGLRDLTGANPYFHPHGYCYLWDTALVWTHVGSDLLIGTAYMTIPIALLSIVRRAEGGLPFSGMLVAFGTFIIACGFTHFVEVLTLWQPWFWTAAAVKVVTAFASVATALAVPPLVPKVIDMLDSTKIAEERRVALERAHAELEDRVRARTEELTATIRRLEDEIVARERAEVQLNLREAQLQGILNHSPAYIFLKDQNLRFTLVNRRLAAAYDGPAAFIGRTNAEIFPAELAAEYDANDRRALAGETVQAVEHEQSTDGVHTYLSEKFPVRDSRGNVVAVGGISTDITDRERLQEHRERLLARERELREQAEQNLREKDEFLAVLSHELRTPLNAVLGYVQLLRGGVVAPERVARTIETIHRNAVALRGLVEDLLTMSGIVAGQLELRIAPVDVAQVVQAAVDAVRPDANVKSIQLLAHFASAPLVRGDAARLQQVFTNLLANAVKFSEAGGRVWIDVAPESGRVRVTIKDEGVGMPADFLAQAFEPFRQRDAGPARAAGGLGLGLAIVRRLLAAHDGEVRAESEGMGKGSVFSVWLPTDDTRSSDVH